jgi:capsular polysaccharide biosynthesis protein
MSEWQVKQKEETEFDLSSTFRALVKWIWVIVAVALIFGVASYIYSSLFVTPTYRTSFTAYVNSRVPTDSNGNVSASDLNSSIGLAYAYKEIITSRSVLVGAAEKSGYAMSYGALSSMVKVTISDSTAVIDVFVEDTDPDRATALATAIAEVAPKHVERVVDGGSLRILDEPVRPNSVYSPNKVQNAMVGALVGMVLSALVVVVLNQINDKVLDVQDLEKRYQIPVVGTIPDINQRKKKRNNKNQAARGYVQ